MEIYNLKLAPDARRIHFFGFKGKRAMPLEFCLATPSDGPIDIAKVIGDDGIDWRQLRCPLHDRSGLIIAP